MQKCNPIKSNTGNSIHLTATEIVKVHEKKNNFFLSIMCKRVIRTILRNSRIYYVDNFRLLEIRIENIETVFKIQKHKQFLLLERY